MYAKIENGVAVEYPIFEGELERRFPDRTYPLDTSGDPIPEGYVRVVSAFKGNTYSVKYIMEMPILIDGIWTESYREVEYTSQEIAFLKEKVDLEVRTKRNKILQLSDYKVFPDIWQAYTDQEKLEWTDYRQALRDVPDQEGFPLDVNWPIEPSVFSVKIIK
jgi:hypothetical protein